MPLCQETAPSVRKWNFGAFMRFYPPILGYHRIGAYRGDHVPTVSTGAFERQLTFLSRYRYRVCSLDEIIQTIDTFGDISLRSVALTFDDGYEEIYHNAWPLLKRFGFSATLFVTPGEVGLPGFATWQQIQQMANQGMSIGNHTMHHSYLPLIQEEQLHEELIDSKLLIEQQIGRTVQFLSYPVGGFSAQIKNRVRDAGYEAAFTTNRAFCGKMLDRFAVRRVKITERDRFPALFWVKLSGYYDFFRRLKAPS